MDQIINSGKSVTIYGQDGDDANLWISTTWNGTIAATTWVQVGANAQLDFMFTSPIDWEYMRIERGDGAGIENISHIVAFISTTSICLTDSDNDDIPDVYDLDSDNDGILDKYETFCDAEVADFTVLNNSSSSSASPYLADGGFSYPDGVVGTWDISLEGQNDVLITQPATLGLGSVCFVFNQSSTNWDLDATFSITTTDLVTQVALYSYTPQTGVNPAYGSKFQKYTISWIGGVGNAVVYDPAGQIDQGDGFKLINGGYFTQTGDSAKPNDTLEWYVVFPIGAKDFQIKAEEGRDKEGFRFATVRCENYDTDEDGIPNYLDTDSDNDGCPDAMEAAGNFTSSELTTLTGGSNGVGSSLLNFGTTVGTTQGSATYGVPIENANELDISANTPQTTTLAVIDNMDSVCVVDDLSLTKKVNTAIVKVGETITYTITVKNSGTVSAIGVQVTDVLPPGLTFDSDNSTTTSTTYNSNIWSIGNLNANQSITLEINAKVTSAGIITNTTEITQSNPELDSTPGNDY